MGKTVRLTLDEPKSPHAHTFTTAPEKSSRADRKKKKDKEIEQRTLRSRENKKLHDAVITESFDGVAIPIKKNSLK